MEVASNRNSGASPARSAGKTALLRGAAMAGVLSVSGGAAFAQSASAASEAPAAAPSNITEVVVTASRITRNGYTAPTPTTVVSAAQIQTAAPASIADYVNELPALVGSITPRVATTGASATVGANLLNLRALGANRTLVLLDGHRVAPTTLTGNIDTGMLPSALVQRVDIVTGGASAAWGSDAVAGVVNFVLDRNFTGLKGDVQGGVSQRGDAGFLKTELSYGAKFAQDRGHILVSGEYLNDNGADPVTSRSWFKSYKVINNPAYTPTNGQPLRIVAPNVGLGVATVGGLITSPGALRGAQFDNGGRPEPFNFGFTSGVLSVGGDGQDVSQAIELAVPSRVYNLYSRASYDLTANINAYVEVGYAKADTTIFARPYERDGNITIRNDNAYLDPAVKARMATAGVTSFSLGKIFLDWGPAEGVNDRHQVRIVTGLEGKLGGSWAWDAYYQHGETHFTTGDYTNNPITANFNAAIDAVIGPSGQVACRSTLTTPTNGCVPFNVFGSGRLTAATAAYMFGQSVQYTTIKQDVAAASIHGEPFSLWAGPVSIATGAEYRKEQYAATTDALSPSTPFFLGNYKPSRGSFDVKEGFLEVVAPLLAGQPFAKHLDFNGAVRETHYSLSGSVTSWKVGATWDIDDQLRFRVTRSRDIRAPNLNELFQAGNALNQTINDPVTHTSYSIQQFAGGNLNLKPEQADTTAFGGVFRPSWLSGFAASVDYFDIKINGAIYTQAAQNVIDQCNAGVTSQCAYLTRNAGSGLITTVSLIPQNISSEATRGVDIDVSYHKPLDAFVHDWPGQVTLRALGAYVASRTVTANRVTTQYAGTNANVDQNSEAVPSWRWMMSATYDRGPFSSTVTARYISAGVFNKAWGPLDINNNNIPSVTYVDLAVSYKFEVMGSDSQAYLVVQNLFDKDPPVAPIYGATGFLSSGTNGYLYDLIGRQFRAGIRFAF